MKVLVCGGRDFSNFGVVKSHLDILNKGGDVAQIIHGGARGADSLAGRWAAERGIPVRVFEADWKQYGKSAGPRRNRQMLEEGAPDMVVAFKGGRGTADMVQQAKAAGVLLVSVTSPEASKYQDA